PPPPPRPSLFPYTTLFRSEKRPRPGDVGPEGADCRGRPGSDGERGAGPHARGGRSPGGLLPHPPGGARRAAAGDPSAGSPAAARDRKSTRLNSSHVKISYA